MKAIGIVAEYNPFHQGHRYLVEEGRRELKADVCVSVMSGHFSQRGFPCVSDKWLRAEEAIRGGVDLVLELPVVFSTGSAEVFAKGAVSILEGLGSVDHLVFGSESGDVSALQEAAGFIQCNARQINETAAALQKQGIPYPKAREEACGFLDPGFDLSLIREPNNILALEYLKWTKRMEPYTVKRNDQGYHATGRAIREELLRREPEAFREREVRYFNLLRYSVLSKNQEELSRFSGAEGGLGNRLKKEIIFAEGLEDLIRRVKSKVYTRTRITRYLTHVLLGITDELEQVPLYGRVLGFNDRGAAFLKHCTSRELTKIPLLVNVKKDSDACPEVLPLLQRDMLATQVFQLITGGDLYLEHDFVRKPIVLAGETG